MIHFQQLRPTYAQGNGVPTFLQWSHISFVIISTWLIHRASTRGKWYYAISLLSITFTALIRPNGWLFMIIAPVYWLIRANLANWKKWVGVVIVLFCFVVGVLFVQKLRNAVQAEQPDLWLRDGIIIWGYDSWRFPMPVDSSINNDGLVSGIRYGLKHPISSLGLALSRVMTEVLHVRPFYSIVHNVVALIVVIPIYILSTFGYSRTRSRPITNLLAFVIISHLIIVALTFADWDGRFLLYIFPLICVFAAVGMVNFIRSWYPAGKLPS